MRGRILPAYPGFHEFPVFKTGDIAVTIAAVLMTILHIRGSPAINGPGFLFWNRIP